MKPHLSLAVLCLGAALLGTSCGESRPVLLVPDISPKTESECAEAVDVMRDAWRARPRETSEENFKAEQRFLARMISLANQTKGTGNFKAVKVLWREVLTEHQSDYPPAKP